MTTPIGKPPLHPDHSAASDKPIETTKEVTEHFRILLLGTPHPFIDENGKITMWYEFEGKFYKDPE